MDISVKEKFNNAFKLHGSGKTDEAEKLYLEILQETPENYEVLNLLGILYFTQNELSKAEEYIVKAISLKKDAYFYENLAKVYEKKKDYVSEIKILNEAVEYTNCGFEIYFLLGLAYKNNIQYEDAETAYLKALELNPESEKACFNLATVYWFVNKPNRRGHTLTKSFEIKLQAN